MGTYTRVTKEYGMVLAEGYTEPGLRTVNEDAFLLGDAIEQRDYKKSVSVKMIPGDEIMVFAVADGVTSEGDGEVVSYKALQALQEWCHEFDSWNAENPNASTEDFVREGFIETNDVILEYHKEVGGCSATTLSALFLKGNEFWVANVGDSPIFARLNKQMERLDQEHTVAARKSREGIDPGIYDEHTLDAYIGMYREDLVKKMHITCGECGRGDSFILCTDGLTKAIGNSGVEDLIVADSENGTFLMRLKDVLNKRHIDDNCTAIRIELCRVDTKLLSSDAESIESYSQLVKMTNKPNSFDTWRLMFHKLSPYDKEEILKRLRNDWDIQRRTAKGWLESIPSRDTVLRICWTLEFELGKTNRVLTHYAGYSALDKRNLLDQPWIKLVSADRLSVMDLGGPKLFLEEAETSTDDTGLPIWKEYTQEVMRRWKENSLTVKGLWGTSESRSRAHNSIEGRPKNGQIVPRTFIIALNLKEERNLDEINKDLTLNGMEPLGRKNVFETALISVLEDIQMNLPELFGNNLNYYLNSEEKDFNFDADSDKCSGNDLEEEVIKRLEEIPQGIEGSDRREEFEEMLEDLKYYL